MSCILRNVSRHTVVCHAAQDRVRNLKNHLLQIDLPTIMGCSLWYPIARSTMKPEA